MKRNTEEILISADSHVTEPGDLWEKRLPAGLRDRAPKFGAPASTRRGRPPIHLNSEREAELEPVKNEDRRGGWDPLERLKEMAIDGVSGEVLYPSRGGKLFYIEDARLQEACARIYNDWLIDFCAAAPDRLLGVGIIAAYDMDHAVGELTRCREQGLRGATIWQLPPPSLPFTSDHYERFWAAAQDLQMSVSLHILTGHKSNGFQSYRGLDAYRFGINGKTEEITHALLDIILSGVLERFPRLTLVVVENEIGWIPFWLEQCDKYFERFRRVEPLSLKMRPSEYFNRQIYATFFNDEVGARLLSWWGVDNCMWSNDYPHSNSTWPYSREVIERDFGSLAAGERAKLVRLNAAKIYNIDLPSDASVMQPSGKHEAHQ